MVNKLKDLINFNESNSIGEWPLDAIPKNENANISFSKLQNEINLRHIR